MNNEELGMPAPDRIGTGGRTQRGGKIEELRMKNACPCPRDWKNVELMQVVGACHNLNSAGLNVMTH